MVRSQQLREKKVVCNCAQRTQQKKKDKLNERSRKKSSVGGAILFSFFFSSIWQFFFCWFNHSASLLFFCVDSIIHLPFFFCVKSIIRLPFFFCWFNHPTNGQFFICVFVFVDTNSIQREEQNKKCKCQKLLKTFRIKKVPSKRNVFNDVIDWLSSVCNNMLYLTTQVVKRECHL